MSCPAQCIYLLQPAWLIYLAQPITYHRPSRLRLPVPHRNHVWLTCLARHRMCFIPIAFHRMHLNHILHHMRLIPLGHSRVRLLLRQLGNRLSIVITCPCSHRSLGLVLRAGRCIDMPALLIWTLTFLLVFSESFSHLHHCFVTPQFILIRTLPCVSALLLWLLAALLLGTVHACLCSRAPVLQTILHGFQSILNFPPLIEIVQSLTICGQAGLHFELLGVRNLHLACLPRMGCRLLDLLVVQILLKSGRKNSLLRT